MSELDQHRSLNHSLNAFSEALKSGRFVRMRRLLASLHPAETAHLLESLPPMNGWYAGQSSTLSYEVRYFPILGKMFVPA